MKKNEKTHTICGTLYYIAPEIIKKQGHSHVADWWSLGILTFEMLFGVPPWHSKNERILLKAIVSGNLVFLDERKIISAEAKEFISKLLLRDP